MALPLTPADIWRFTSSSAKEGNVKLRLAEKDRTNRSVLDRNLRAVNLDFMIIFPLESLSMANNLGSDPVDFSLSEGRSQRFLATVRINLPLPLILTLSIKSLESKVERHHFSDTHFNSLLVRGPPCPDSQEDHKETVPTSKRTELKVP